MKKRKKKTLYCSKKMMLLLVLLFIIPFLSSMKANAAKNKLIPLKSSKVYRDYDLSRDGKKDKLRIKIYNNKLNLYINNEVCSWHWFDYPNFPQDYGVPFKTSVHLYVLNNGNCYIGISVTGNYDTNGFHVLYRYKPGMLIPVLNVNKLFNSDVGGLAGQGHIAKPLNVNGNTITMKYSTGITIGGIFEYNIRYRLSGDKLKPVDTKYKITKIIKPYGVKTISVLKPFKIYTQPGGKKVSFTTAPGEKLKPLQICSKGKKSYILVRGNRKKIGWTNIDFKYGTISSM